MQNQSSISLFINGIHINAQLNTSAATGLASLLQNAPLLAIADHYSYPMPRQCVSRLQSDIQHTANVFGDVLTALSFAAHDDCEHITPSIVADFAMTVGELLPFLTRLSENINYTHS